MMTISSAGGSFFPKSCCKAGVAEVPVLDMQDRNEEEADAVGHCTTSPHPVYYFLKIKPDVINPAICSF